MNAGSEAARKANETRRTRADIATLRGHFTGAPKSSVRDEVVAFLAEYTRPGERVGDLLGPAWSALALKAAGLDVVAAENCAWSSRVLGSRERAAAAARQMAADGKFTVSLSPFAAIISSVTTAFYDPCGPYLEPTSRDVRAMARRGLRAFVVTVLFSRVEGMKGKPASHYRRLAEVGLAEDAPDYSVQNVVEYRGESGLPMAAFFLVSRRELDRRFAERQEKRQQEREYYEKTRPSMYEFLVSVGRCEHCGGMIGETGRHPISGHFDFGHVVDWWYEGRAIRTFNKRCSEHAYDADLFGIARDTSLDPNEMCERRADGSVARWWVAEPRMLAA